MLSSEVSAANVAAFLSYLEQAARRGQLSGRVALLTLQFLAQHLELHERTRVQGLTDTLIWSSAAVASLGSGFVLAYAGYAILGLMGAALVIVPMLLVAARRSALA